MKRRHLVYLVLLVTVTALFTACGGGGGGPTPSVALTAAYPDYFTTMPETFALANNADAVAITASVKNADGTTAADGTTVTFSAPAGTTLSSTTATSTGGTATVTVKHVAATAPARNVTVPVTASALGVSSSINVKFINQPSSVDVSVALTPSLIGVEAVQLDISSTAGVIAGPAAPTTVGINAGVNGIFATSFDATNNLSHVGALFTPPGINTTASVPVIKITYNVTAAAGVADFTPAAPSGGYIVAGASGATLISPAPSTLSFVVTFKYDTE